MKENKYMQCILCEGKTLADAVSKFNEEMKRNAQFRPTYERVGDSFLIYVKVVEVMPESIAEANFMQGCRHRCEECSHCVRTKKTDGSTDYRSKHAKCAYSGNRVRTDGWVCDTFYLEQQDRKEG